MERPGSADPNGEKAAERTWECPGHHPGRPPRAQRRRPLLYRYPPGRDGLPGTEGAFLPCSFWLVQARASTGRVDETAQLFADLLELANPLGPARGDQHQAPRYLGALGAGGWPQMSWLKERRAAQKMARRLETVLLTAARGDVTAPLSWPTRRPPSTPRGWGHLPCCSRRGWRVPMLVRGPAQKRIGHLWATTPPPRHDKT
jgi:hypothetical protein